MQTRSRSDKNAADAKLVRDLAKSCLHDLVPVFLYGLHRHMAPLTAVSRRGRHAPLPRGAGWEGAPRCFAVSQKAPFLAPEYIFPTASISTHMPAAIAPKLYTNSIKDSGRHTRTRAKAAPAAERCPDSPMGRGADHCRIQPRERSYPSADRIKTLALSEVPHELSVHYVFIRAGARLQRDRNALSASPAAPPNLLPIPPISY